jgi:hypothetical protein
MIFANSPPPASVRDDERRRGDAACTGGSQIADARFELGKRSAPLRPHASRIPRTNGQRARAGARGGRRSTRIRDLVENRVRARRWRRSVRRVGTAMRRVRPACARCASAKAAGLGLNRGEIRFRSCRPPGPGRFKFQTDSFQPTRGRRNVRAFSHRRSIGRRLHRRRQAGDTGQCIKGASGDYKDCRGGCKEDFRPRRTPASAATTIVSRRAEVRANVDATGDAAISGHARRRDHQLTSIYPTGPTAIRTTTRR